MRRISVVFFVTVFLLSAWGVVASRGQEGETAPERWTTIALDLMDLEIPGEGSGNEMELPPIQGAERREVEPEPPAEPRKPPQLERSVSGLPEGSRSVPPPAPGLAPFLLEEPGFEGGETRHLSEPTPDREPAPLAEEFPAELKTVAPPPSSTESLKLTPEMDMRASGGSDVPEIPLLEGGVRGQQVTSGQDSSLMLKSFPALRDGTDASRGARPSRKGRRPEDYLQVREDMDARLMDLYERYYKDR